MGSRAVAGRRTRGLFSQVHVLVWNVILGARQPAPFSGLGFVYV